MGQLLQELAKNIDSREHANVGFMVIKLFPDQDTSSRTAHLDPSAWDHVMCGWDFAALAQSGAASPADESQLALLATKWEEGQTQHMDFTQHRMLQANIDASITSGRDMFAGMVGDRMTAMRDSLSSLEECAGGKTDRESWESGLNDDSTWEHVRREADYYLKRKQEQGPLHKHLDIAFQDLKIVRKRLEAANAGLNTMCRLNGEAGAGGSIDELMHKADDISSKARATHTESYFYHLLEGNEKDRANKIQSRITEMAKHRLSTSSLQAILWRKALAVSTSRK